MKKQNPLRVVGIFAAILVTIVASIVALNSKNTSHLEDHKLHIVAAENFWGSIASQIGGDSVSVTSIIDSPNVDPHLYESNARNATAIATADIVISNGLGYDDFMNKLLSVSSGDNRETLSVAKTLGVTSSAANPHLWYDVSKAAGFAKALEKVLAAKDPRNVNTYQTNLAAFQKELQPVRDILQKIRTNYSGVSVAYTERLPEYLLQATGLNNKTPVGFSEAIEEGNEPSPADSTAMDALFTKHQVRALLYNTQATSKMTEHVRDLARKNGVATIGISETMPSSGVAYQSWMLHQAEALLKALESR